MMKLFKQAIKNHEKILTVLVYVALFLSLIYPHQDKDWGWHYKYGQYFFDQGQILVRDIYSWTMSGYAWINHEWLYDPIIYILSNNFNFTQLAIIGGLISFACFYLITRHVKLNYLSLVILAFFFQKLMETGIREGLRSQSLAFLPLSLLIFLLLKGKKQIKYLYFLPPLFFLWSNIHGTFVLGIAITAVFLGIYFFQKNENRIKLLTIGLLSVAATFLNPFTYHPYMEAIRHTSSPYLRNVFEWMPINLDCSYCNIPTLTIYTITIVVAMFTISSRISLPFIIVFVALFFQSLGARRYLPLLGLTTLPFLAIYLEEISEKWINPKKYILAPFIVFLITIIAIQYNLFSRFRDFHLYNFTKRDYCLFSSKCSVDLMEYIKKQPPEGNGFNFYDWGGYLIGEDFPGKLFIDGRMHLWKARGYSTFGDYIDMNYNGNLDKFKEYNFDWVITPPNSQVAEYILNPQSGIWKVEFRDEYAIYAIRIR